MVIEKKLNLDPVWNFGLNWLSLHCTKDEP